MPPEQKDTRAILEELKAALTVLSSNMGWQDLTPSEQRRIWELKMKLIDVLELLREEIIARQTMLHVERQQIEEVFNRLGVRRRRR